MKQRGVFEKIPGSGIWWIRYVDADGRLRREKVGSKRAAIALYQKRKTEAREGRKLPHNLRRPATTFEEIARDALAYSKAHKRTYSDDDQRMTRMLKWFRGRAAESITPQEIERHFENGVAEHGWAPSTVNHHRSLLSLAYQLAVRNRKVTINNPARATKHRKEDNNRVRYLSPEEETKLRKVVAANWPEHLPELDLALHTGLRRSEMYTLAWEDVDVGRRFIRVRRGKNGDARYVRLNSIALAALQKLRPDGDEKGPVIRSRSGIALQSPRHWFEKAITKTGIENFHWHDLRHTFASRLTMLGVGIRAVQEALGHKSIAMTVRYSHLSPDFLQDAVEKLVPEPTETTSSKRTDTRTDTGDCATTASTSSNVH